MVRERIFPKRDMGSDGEEAGMSVARRIEKYLRDYTVVAELDFSSHEPNRESLLRLTLENENGEIRSVEFGHVQQLALKEFFPFTQLMLITIEDVSDAQLEGIRFRVRDIEHERISFTCDSMKILG